MWIIQINVSLSSLESLLVCVIHGLNKGGSHKSLKVKTFDQRPLVCVVGLWFREWLYMSTQNPRQVPCPPKAYPFLEQCLKSMENCKGDMMDSQVTSCVSLSVTAWYLQQSRWDLKISKNSKGQCRPSFRQSGPNFALPLEDYLEFYKRTAISMLARSGSLSLKCMVESENN